MAVTFDRIPFDDDADEVRTWKGLALSAIMDLRRYAHDEGPERRLVSAEAYEADAVRLEQGGAKVIPQPHQAGRWIVAGSDGRSVDGVSYPSEEAASKAIGSE